MAKHATLSRVWLCGSCLVGLSACGSQFTDPIREQAAAAECETRVVAQLDGTTFASVPRVIQDDFSIELWLKADSSPSGDFFADSSALVFSDVETVQVDDFAAGILNGKFLFSVGAPDTAATSVSDVATGAWTHVAATRSAETGIVLVYVNGVLEAAQVGNTNPLDDAPTLDLGGRSGRNFFSGVFSELRIWNDVRSQSELTANLRAPLTGGEQGLVGYYPFDDGAGATARDSSPTHADAVFDAPLEWPTTASPFCQP
jgi:hypothetical protein